MIALHPYKEKPLRSFHNAILNALLRKEIANASQRRKFLASSPKEVLSAEAKQVLGDCERLGICIAYHWGEDYPPAFVPMPDPPLILFIAGEVGSLWCNSVAIVGGRQATGSGKRLASRIAQDLSNGNLVVVSGLALGIDTAAHEGALKGKSPTVAVLGGGHEQLYPRKNAGLAKRICESEGAVVSEYPPHWSPTKLTFPERNRIISGLSHGILLIEAREKSGSLITASYALEQGKEVMVVPGPVESHLSRGGHQLIREGAGLVESAEDVYSLLGVQPETLIIYQGPEDLTERQKKVLDAVDYSETSMDTIIERTGYDASLALGLLIDLEIYEFVERGKSGYIRAATN